MTLKPLFPAALALLLLTACTGVQDSRQGAKQLQALYRSAPAIETQAEIVADYGERSYTYTAAIQGTESAGTLRVLAPDSIAGTGTAWQEGKTVLDYDGISLETGPLSPDGLSPADGIPVLLTVLRTGAVAESGWTDWGEAKHCLYLLLENPGEKDSTVAVWAEAETGALVHAELLWQEKRVLSFTFTDFVIQ